MVDKLIKYIVGSVQELVNSLNDPEISKRKKILNVLGLFYIGIFFVSAIASLLTSLFVDVELPFTAMFMGYFVFILLIGIILSAIIYTIYRLINSTLLGALFSLIGVLIFIGLATYIVISSSDFFYSLLDLTVERDFFISSYINILAISFSVIVPLWILNVNIKDQKEYREMISKHHSENIYLELVENRLKIIRERFITYQKDLTNNDFYNIFDSYRFNEDYFYEVYFSTKNLSFIDAFDLLSFKVYYNDDFYRFVLSYNDSLIKTIKSKITLMSRTYIFITYLDNRISISSEIRKNIYSKLGLFFSSELISVSLGFDEDDESNIHDLITSTINEEIKIFNEINYEQNEEQIEKLVNDYLVALKKHLIDYREKYIKFLKMHEEFLNRLNKETFNKFKD